MARGRRREPSRRLAREPTVVDAEHPLFILYTSGSTGKPKGVLHTTAGYLAGAHVTTQVRLRSARRRRLLVHRRRRLGHRAQLHRLRAALERRDVPDVRGRARTSPTGAASGSIIERHGVTILYTAPTAIRAFIRAGRRVAEEAAISRACASSARVGEPINPEAWIWYHEHIGGGRCPIVDTWWQTETGAIMLTTLPGRAPHEARARRACRSSASSPPW